MSEPSESPESVALSPFQRLKQHHLFIPGMIISFLLLLITLLFLWRYVLEWYYLVHLDYKNDPLGEKVLILFFLSIAWLTYKKKIGDHAWLLTPFVIILYCFFLHKYNDLLPITNIFIDFTIIGILSFLISRIQKPGFGPALVTLIFFFAFYTGSYVKFLMVQEPLTLFDFQQAELFIHTMPLLVIILISIGLAAFAYLFYRSLDLSNRRHLIQLTLGGLPILIVILMTIHAPNLIMQSMDGWKKISNSHRARDFQKHGTIFMLMRDTAQSARTQELLDAIQEAPFDDTVPHLGRNAYALITDKRNVHVIVLESFMDFRRFPGVTFEGPILYPPFYDTWMEDNGSSSLSPVFGGRTGDAEFEILCGVPSFQIGGDSEFNMMTGRVIPCLPARLAEIGYATFNSTPVRETFYNKKRAYTSLGFQNIYFNDRFDLSDHDAGWLSNEACLTQHNAFVAEILKEHNGPIFDFMMTTGGHWPFINQQTHKRPSVNKAVAPDDLTYSKIVHHSYYTTKALQEYIEHWRKEDPESLIVIINDHLPYMGMNYKLYRKGSFDNAQVAPPHIRMRKTFMMMIDGGKRVDVGMVTHHQMPEIILNRLSDGRYCDTYTCHHDDLFLYRNPYFVHKSDVDVTLCSGNSSGSDVSDDHGTNNRDPLDQKNREQFLRLNASGEPEWDEQKICDAGKPLADRLHNAYLRLIKRGRQSPNTL
ncbi:MAG: LTA synthase family protein [Magnetococcales bacterium]|nr:LTA synthase family protein [Magnetococcales bacterium]